MSKVFRLYKEGATAFQGWSENMTFPYNSTARENIEDPEGATARNEITSIPSPFARIDLVKTAFKEVCRMATKDVKQLNGKTIFHKMVSDALDVGEIFFNIDKFKNQVEVITWEPQKMIDELKHDGNEGHRYLGDALEKYMLSDEKTYNFDQLRNIYLLNYKNGPDELNIIGATSPSTLFFSNANDLSYIDDIYFANNDRPFDREYNPLYNRDEQYIKALMCMRKTTPNFSTRFPEVDNYLQLTFKAITDTALKQSLSTLNEASTKEFSEIDILGEGYSNQVEVLGYPIFKKKAIEPKENEFTIAADFEVAGKKPLVLPVESGNKYAEMQYVSGAWGTSNKVPYHCETALEERTLPFEGSTFPYLTISDFLEDHVGFVEHQLNKDYFFDGRFESKEPQKSFLLPLTPLYFQYFSLDTLKGTMSDGKPAIEMQELAGGSVNVILRIPVRGNSRITYIEYQRLYYSNRRAEISATTNNGGIINMDFTGLVMPAVSFKNSDEAYYTVSCVSTFSKKFVLDFYHHGNLLRGIPMDCRNTEQGYYDYKAETYTIDKQNFEVIRVTDGLHHFSNVLVTNFPMQQNVERYEFAVDLGTSNTHIEYKRADSNQSMPFDYKDTEGLYATFFVPTFEEIAGKNLQKDLSAENELMATDFIPTGIGKDSDFGFPTRTVMSHARSLDWSKELNNFGLYNFNLTYNKHCNIKYNAKPLVNIKWSNDEHAQIAMQAFIRNIMLMIRNKVMANQGNLKETKVTWFYPKSMSRRRLSKLKEAWNTAYKELINPNGETVSISESVAPILFYSNKNNVDYLVNVDIGGGTTDIAFSTEGKVTHITSFKFAANSLFEDSLSEINNSNGIVDFFKEEMFEMLKSGENTNELMNVYKEIERPSDMASFLFSLKDNSATKGIARNKIDFNAKLQADEQFKIVFILFYTAIIYHIAQIVKKEGMDWPRHIAFSGNGSKLLRVISNDAESLAQYTKVVFEQLLEGRYPTDLEILGFHQEANPKEATSKGGLMARENNESEASMLVLKDCTGRMLTSEDTYQALLDDHRAQEKIVESVNAFFKFALKKIPASFKLDDYFGVDKSAIDIAREVSQKDLATYFKKGLKMAVEESGNPENPIEDALFFYPIKGVLQALSEKLKVYYTQQ